MTLPSAALNSAGRPVVWVDGALAPEVTDRVLHLVVIHPLAGQGSCELVLDNWGPTDTGMGLVLSDRHVLDCGRLLAIELGGGTVFSGLVSAVEERYAADRAPQLVIHAQTRRKAWHPTAAHGMPAPGPRPTTTPPADAAIALSVGRELLDASLVRRISDGHLGISGTGTTPADARLHPGTVVDIAGAAPDFDGHYRVTAVQHTFDTTIAGRSTIQVDHTANARSIPG